MSLELNCANFSDKKTGELFFPPAGAKTYANPIDRKNLKKIAKSLSSSEKLVIPAGIIERKKGNESVEQR